MRRPSALNRRDFLLLRLGSRHGVMELSCERLLMKYVDAEANGTTSSLFARLDRELKNVRELRVVDPEWLSRDDLAAALERVLDEFKARGGSVV